MIYVEEFCLEGLRSTFISLAQRAKLEGLGGLFLRVRIIHVIFSLAKYEMKKSKVFESHIFACLFLSIH